MKLFLPLGTDASHLRGRADPSSCSPSPHRARCFPGPARKTLTRSHSDTQHTRPAPKHPVRQGFCQLLVLFDQHRDLNHWGDHTDPPATKSSLSTPSARHGTLPVGTSTKHSCPRPPSLLLTVPSLQPPQQGGLFPGHTLFTIFNSYLACSQKM